MVQLNTIKSQDDRQDCSLQIQTATVGFYVKTYFLCYLYVFWSGFTLGGIYMSHNYGGGPQGFYYKAFPFLGISSLIFIKLFKDFFQNPEVTPKGRMLFKMCFCFIMFPAGGMAAFCFPVFQRLFGNPCIDNVLIDAALLALAILAWDHWKSKKLFIGKESGDVVK